MIREEEVTAQPVWGERQTLVSFVREVPELDLLNALRAAEGEPRLYWRHEAQDAAYVGIGVAAALSAEGQSRIARIQLQIDHLFEGAYIAGNSPNETSPRETAPRLFGGFAFGSHYVPSGIWQAFPSAYFVLPRVQITQRNGGTWMTVNRNVGASEPREAVLKALEHEAEAAICQFSEYRAPADTAVAASRIRYPMARDDWRTMITTATDRIRAGRLDKVVLSRVCDAEFADTVDPVRVVAELEARYPDCYRFLFEVAPEHAFFGATPELLVEVHEAQLHTMALAGSRRRGATPEEDAALADDMLNSPKERHEHDLVVQAVRERVRPYVRALDVPETPTIFRLRNIQHLYTPVRAELETHFDVLDLVGELHPTPALGGSPRRAALEAIQQLEREERGWYAAPVGWVDASGDGMFAVAIRSAVSAGQTARLYAGVGIVADSDPDKEWDETNLKFRPLLSALGAEA